MACSCQQADPSCSEQHGSCSLGTPWERERAPPHQHGSSSGDSHTGENKGQEHLHPIDHWGSNSWSRSKTGRWGNSKSSTNMLFRQMPSEVVLKDGHLSIIGASLTELPESLRKFSDQVTQLDLSYNCFTFVVGLLYDLNPVEP